MRVLIVDDEAPARARLQRLLLTHPDVRVVGQAADGADALQQVATLTPDVLLLDIQMPGISGLDVAVSLSDPAPAVVFVSAHDHYALPAFEAAAVDYLLKPVEPVRLARTLQRLRRRLARQTGDAPLPLRPPPAQLLIPDRGRTHVLAVDRILWLEAADNYVVVHSADQGQPLMRRTLAGLLVDLGEGFMRCHRGAAVALAQVQSVQTRDKGDALIQLRGGAQVPCSRPFRAALLARLAGRS